MSLDIRTTTVMLIVAIDLLMSFYHYVKYRCVNRKICFLIISFVNLLEKMRTLILTEVRSDYKVG